MLLQTLFFKVQAIEQMDVSLFLIQSWYSQKPLKIIFKSKLSNSALTTKK
jgi:hypothetical protein